MLSQRIAGIIVQAFLEKGSAERNARITMVDDAIKLMSESHLFLVGRGAKNTDTVMSEATSVIYFGSAKNLDQKVKAYLTEAKALRNAAVDGRNVNRVRISAFADTGFGSLLHLLDSAVNQYQEDAEAKLSNLRTLNVGLWMFTIAVILLELALIFRPLARRLDEAQQELEDIAHTDPLTGCWNRRALMKSGEMLWSLAKRQDRPLSVIICDIDNFKRINDAYGHGIGDEAIKVVAQTCIDALRQYDVFGRFGGEEFVLILPDTEESGAKLVGERIRRSLEEKIISAENVSFKMTASFGTATIREQDNSLQALIDRADQALYAAKENGRNQVEAWRPEIAVAA